MVAWANRDLFCNRIDADDSCAAGRAIYAADRCSYATNSSFQLAARFDDRSGRVHIAKALAALGLLRTHLCAAAGRQAVG
jgi:hypothetical protein